MFIDHVIIQVKAGDGGDGCLAFRREKFVPKGGPSGGNGGRGGNIYFHSNPDLNTLLSLKYWRQITAQRGGHGSGNHCQGKSGVDLIIEVPVGTQICDGESGRILFDLNAPQQMVLAAQGGRGGRGNATFATPSNRAPRKIEKGKPGQERIFCLELKILADVGLIGYPNAGKSTLISVLSDAKPRIAEYPFTTLTPHLGVVCCGSYRSFIAADIPGMIEGAHQGSGLGDRFLRHVERTRLLVHVVDISDLGGPDPVHVLKSVEKELRLYHSRLIQKPRIIAASKIDLANSEKLKRLRIHCSRSGLPFYLISALTGVGISELREAMAKHLGVQLT